MNFKLIYVDYMISCVFVIGVGGVVGWFVIFGFVRYGVRKIVGLDFNVEVLEGIVGVFFKVSFEVEFIFLKVDFMLEEVVLVSIVMVVNCFGWIDFVINVVGIG